MVEGSVGCKLKVPLCLLVIVLFEVRPQKNTVEAYPICMQGHNLDQSLLSVLDRQLRVTLVQGEFCNIGVRYQIEFPSKSFVHVLLHLQTAEGFLDLLVVLKVGHVLEDLLVRDIAKAVGPSFGRHQKQAVVGLWVSERALCLAELAEELVHLERQVVLVLLRGLGEWFLLLGLEVLAELVH